MNKRNLIIQAALTCAFGAASLSANAGVATGYPEQVASQAVVSNATIVQTGALAYGTQAVIAEPSTVYVYVKLNGGAKFVDTGAGSIVAGALIAGNTGAATATVGAGTPSTDGTFAVFPVVITVASVPVNATFTFRPTGVAATDGAVTNALAAATSGTLTGTISIGSTQNLTTPQTDIDSAASGNLIDLVPGETFTALSSGSFTGAGTPAPFATAVGAETAQIDVVGGAGVAFVNNINVAASPVLVDFGGYYFKDVPGVLGASGAAFNLATDYAATYSATLTGNFAAAQATGGSVFLATNATCATPVATGSAGTINAAGTSVAFSGIAAAVTNTPVYVCMHLDTSNAVPVPSTTPSLVVTLAPTAAATAAPIVTPAASLYPLITNGAQVYVRSYIPAAVAGFTSYIRVINTGGVTANISGSFINDATGVAGKSGVISTALLPGAAVTLPSSAIETSIGAAPAAASRPRLLVTAPTTIAVQSFIYTASSGDFNEVSSGSTGGQ